MTIRFLPQAEWELDEAFAWYKAQYQGLGYRFLDEFDATLRRIQAYPDAHSVIACAPLFVEAFSVCGDLRYRTRRHDYYCRRASTP